ncbi:subtilisin-like protein [Gigaspora margarita]|uniref:Subtilisin-like protein n=1 Tax=Gigaspora margarita TaxID=4874 RepID=A0A8H3XLT0_GIGMA|nr:subtilisin-like protein [Gigaspora margarita]
MMSLEDEHHSVRLSFKVVQAQMTMALSVSLCGAISKSFNDAIGSTTKNGTMKVGVTEATSNPIVDFTNIGRYIISAGINNKIAILSGLVQAAPYDSSVTGTIALIIANIGNLSPSKMKE